IFVQGAELEIPYSFEDGQVTSAEQMNTNFREIQKVVNDNYAQLNKSLGEIEKVVNDSHAQPNKSFDEARPVFLGFTPASAEPLRGDGGIFQLQKACQVWKPNSNICSESELLRSNYNSNAVDELRDSNTWAWVVVEKDYTEFAVRRGPKNDGYVVDTSGSVSFCRVSSGGSVSNLAVDAKGKFEMRACKKSARVACCE
ncbi:MAG: hypothetical protein QF884_06485, partial [Porticoccaceae bacterium]|nr:hypothetical protein [Porticoccaceae bacterium]